MLTLNTVCQVGRQWLLFLQSTVRYDPIGDRTFDLRISEQTFYHSTTELMIAAFVIKLWLVIWL